MKKHMEFPLNHMIMYINEEMEDDFYHFCESYEILGLLFSLEIFHCKSIEQAFQYNFLFMYRKKDKTKAVVQS